MKENGIIMQGNHRAKVLEERGYDLNRLWELTETSQKESALKALESLFKGKNPK